MFEGSIGSEVISASCFVPPVVLMFRVWSLINFQYVRSFLADAAFHFDGFFLAQVSSLLISDIDIAELEDFEEVEAALFALNVSADIGAIGLETSAMESIGIAFRAVVTAALAIAFGGLFRGGGVRHGVPPVDG